jgi:hypothetical protein
MWSLSKGVTLSLSKGVTLLVALPPPSKDIPPSLLEFNAIIITSRWDFSPLFEREG